jgi:hypothetical protein
MSQKSLLAQKAKLQFHLFSKARKGHRLKAEFQNALTVKQHVIAHCGSKLGRRMGASQLIIYPEIGQETVEELSAHANWL